PSQVIGMGIIVLVAGLTLVQSIIDGITRAPVTSTARFFEALLSTAPSWAELVWAFNFPNGSDTPCHRWHPCLRRCTTKSRFWSSPAELARQASLMPATQRGKKCSSPALLPQPACSFTTLWSFLLAPAWLWPLEFPLSSS